MTTPTDGPPHGREAGIAIRGDMIEFAMRIRGFSQVQLSRRAGISNSHLSRLLGGERSASTGTVQKIIAAFDGNIRWDEVVVVEEHPDDALPDIDLTAAEGND